MVVKVNDKTNDFRYLIYDEIKNRFVEVKESVSLVCVNKIIGNLKSLSIN